MVEPNKAQSYVGNVPQDEVHKEENVDPEKFKKVLKVDASTDADKRDPKRQRHKTGAELESEEDEAGPQQPQAPAAETSFSEVMKDAREADSIFDSTGSTQTRTPSNYGSEEDTTDYSYQEAQSQGLRKNVYGEGPQIPTDETYSDEEAPPPPPSETAETHQKKEAQKQHQLGIEDPEGPAAKEELELKKTLKERREEFAAKHPPKDKPAEKAAAHLPGREKKARESWKEKKLREKFERLQAKKTPEKTRAERLKEQTQESTKTPEYSFEKALPQKHPTTKVVSFPTIHGEMAVEHDAKGKKKSTKYDAAIEEVAASAKTRLDAQVVKVPEVSETQAGKFPPEVYALFEKMVGLITVQQTRGETKTTVTLDMKNSVFHGAELVITRTDTAMDTFNVKLHGSPEAVTMFNANAQDLAAAMSKRDLPFRINVQKGSLQKRYAVQKKGGAKKG